MPERPEPTDEEDPRGAEDMLPREETYDAASAPTPEEIAKANRRRIAIQNHFWGTPV